MTDLKDDVEASLAEVKAKIAAVDGDAKADEVKTSTWVAAHHVYIYVALAFVVGALVGHFLH